MANSDMDHLTVSRTRGLLAVLIPVHFAASVPERRIRSILSRLLDGADLFCRPEHRLTVVDRGTVADRVLQEFSGLKIHRLDRNRGKAGAIAAGLAELLEISDASYIATQDCDGDHAHEDLPRLVSLAAWAEGTTGCAEVTVMGARPSLEKPMGWIRDQWERLTNAVLVDALGYILAREERVLDRRFWSGFAPDIQSGLRVYSRRAAERVRDVLSGLPEDREVLTLACEFVSFADLVIAGGITAQVQRFTLVEQPVTSYGEVDFGLVYGRLLAHCAERYGIPGFVLRQIFDNHLVGASLFFTDFREHLLKARHLIEPEPPPVLKAPFL